MRILHVRSEVYDTYLFLKDCESHMLRDTI